MSSSRIFMVMGICLCVVFAGRVLAAPQTITDERGFEKQITEADILFQTGTQYMDAGDYAKAAETFEKVTKLDDSRLDAFHSLSESYSKLGMYDKAAAAYVRACEAHPDDLLLLSNLGYYQVRAEEYEEAKTTYNKIVEAKPDDYEAHLRLGFIYKGLGDKETALSYYEKAIKLKPDDASTMGSVARLYEEKGQKDDAIRMYKKAIAASTDVADANRYKSAIGKMYIKQEKFKESARIYEALVVAEPTKYSHHFNLGISYMKTKMPGDAIPEFAQAVELKPEFSDAYLYLAMSYNDVGKPSQAIETVQTGLKVSEKRAGLYCAWGKSLEKLTRFDEAIDKFANAIDDRQWGNYAKKQIQRQEDLKKRAELIQQQG